MQYILECGKVRYRKYIVNNNATVFNLEISDIETGRIMSYITIHARHCYNECNQCCLLCCLELVSHSAIM